MPINSVASSKRFGNKFQLLKFGRSEIIMKIIAFSIVAVILAFHSTAGQETLKDVCKKLLEQKDFKFMEPCKKRRTTTEKCVDRCVKKIDNRRPEYFLQKRLDRMSKRLERIKGRIADREINCDNSERGICTKRDKIQTVKDALTEFKKKIDLISSESNEEVTENTATEGEVTECTGDHGEVTGTTTAPDTTTEGTFASETTAQSTAETTSTAATSTRCENYLSIHTDSAQINNMLAAHNVKRRLFNAGNVNAENGIFPQAASTIPDLKWNSDLADLAQAHSKKCKFKHSTGNSLPDFSYIGENLYTSSGSDSCDTLPDWSNAVAPWYSEIDDFASQDQICNVGRTYVHQSSPALGHFTQIIWQKTTDIGCGIAACDGGSIIITCNYGPGGNFGNQPVYEFGTCPPPA